MGHAYQSELRRWDIVAGLCQAIDARTYVEVGCKEGRTVGFVLANCPNVHAIAIDPWCQQAPSADASRETYAEWDFVKIQNEFHKNTGDYKLRCSIFRMTGHEAVQRKVWRIPGLESIDVVFIDALHDYESVKQDIALWWPLVRPGGYLAGHDYQHRFPGVERAVAEHFNLMDVGLAPDSVWFVRKPALAVAA